jgi:hypothetical protein
MSKVIFSVLFIIFFSYNLYSQYTNVTISSSSSPNEPSICINPKNTNIIVAGANISAYYYSSNSGLNWVTGNLTSSSWGVWGDPIIACDTNQNFYFFHLSNPSSGGHWIDRIVCQKSTNNGVTWNNPGSYTFYDANKDQDKHGVSIDPANNYIYVTWTQFDSYGSTSQLDSSNILFSKSTDGGNTWVNFGTSTAKRINKLGGDCYDEDNTVEGAVPCVGPNGQVYAAWNGPKVRNSQYGIFFNKSTDGGTTWLADPIYICDQPGGWDYMISGIYRCNGLLATACDLSNGPYRGNLYINWTDSAGPNNHDVKFIKSTNGGVNWSAVKKVNTDVTIKEQFLSWMTIDRTTGYIWIVFYDRRDDAGNNNSTEVYLAKSTDGGETFTNFKVSSTPFVPVSSVFFGDYTGISAANSHIRPIWCRLQGSSQSIVTAIVDIPTGENNISENIPGEYKLGQNYPNPFNPTTNISYSLKENTFVSIRIYNLVGQEIAVLVNSNKPAGNYSFTFDLTEYNLPSGVYFYKMTAGNFSETKKMIITK